MADKREHNGANVQRPRSGQPGAAAPQQAPGGRGEAGRQDAVRPNTAPNAAGGQPPKDEPREVVIPGRATKRRAFFERHTGAGAQIIGLVVVLVAVVSLVLSRCDAKKTEQDAGPSGAPPMQGMVTDGPEYEPAPPATEAAPPPAQPAGLQFTEAQTAAMNAFLDEWADQETMVDVRKVDEDGNKIGKEPQMEARGGHDVAVWFYDVESGAEYGYNTAHPFVYASLMKAPYALYLYEKADAGEVDLAAPVAVTEDHLEKYKDNSGVLKEMKLPQTMTVEDLIGIMLEYSDTVALKVLTELYPADGFKVWAAEHGVQNTDELSTLLSGRIPAAELSGMLKAIYAYVRTGPNGGLLREHLLNGNYTLLALDVPVLHKYGWDEYAYHDMAIVEAEYPYLLIIMTDKWAGTWEERKVFGQVAEMLEGYMNEARAQ